MGTENHGAGGGERHTERARERVEGKEAGARETEPKPTGINSFK